MPKIQNPAFQAVFCAFRAQKIPFKKRCVGTAPNRPDMTRYSYAGRCHIKTGTQGIILTESGHFIF